MLVRRQLSELLPGEPELIYWRYIYKEIGSYDSFTPIYRLRQLNCYQYCSEPVATAEKRFMADSARGESIHTSLYTVEPLNVGHLRDIYYSETPPTLAIIIVRGGSVLYRDVTLFDNPVSLSKTEFTITPPSVSSLCCIYSSGVCSMSGAVQKHPHGRQGCQERWYRSHWWWWVWFDL